MMEKDLVVIGGGPAGLAAALKAREKGLKDILIVERGDHLGGILNQCIHDGFGVEIFKQALTGPEYAHRYIEEVNEGNIECITNATVTELSKDRILKIVSPMGFLKIKAKAVVLTTGCRERTREMIKIPGTRPAGVYTAGCVQNLMNLGGRMPGKKVVILGSGDIGLIMARRLTLEGAQVLAVLELLPYSNGLKRNIVQCLEDYDIPLMLSHTVVEIKGAKRLASVKIARVDENLKPIKASERMLKCDTLLLSVGLIPENELAEKAGVEMDEKTGGPCVNEFNETSVEGIYAAGNALQVHDLADWATLEGENAGLHAAEYAIRGVRGNRKLKTAAGNGVRQLVPQYYSGKQDLLLTLRVSKPEKNKNLIIRDGDRMIKKTFHKELIPSEMIRLKMTKEEIENTGGLTADVEA
jgi:NADPH-dependent 2,4-dienoyl-CoA reductase/sulfur reductase-like enzyme